MSYALLTWKAQTFWRFNKSSSARPGCPTVGYIAAPLELCQAVSLPASESLNALFVVGRKRRVRGNGKGVASVRDGAAPHNKLLQPTVIPNRMRAASASLHYALTARWTAQRAAAEQQR